MGPLNKPLSGLAGPTLSAPLSLPRFEEAQAGANLELLAFSRDPTTGEMLDIVVGTGPSTVIRATENYCRDVDGVYQRYPVNAQLREGARVTLVGGAGSLVDKAYGTDISGAPLAEVPWTAFHQEAENLQLRSNDLADAGVWAREVAPDPVLSEVGITGESNSATFLEDTNTTSGEWVYSSQTISAGTEAYVGKFFAKADADESRFVEFHVLFSTVLEFGVNGVALSVNTKTGEAAARVDDGVGNEWEVTEEIIAGEKWWKIVISVVSSGQTDIVLGVLPAAGFTLGTFNATVTGSLVIGNAELYKDATISHVRNLPPIFTTTAAVSIDGGSRSIPEANHSNEAAYYFECKTSGAQSLISAFISVTGSNFLFTDGVSTVTRPWTAEAVHRVGVIAGESKMNICVDGAWAGEDVYDGSMSAGILSLMLNSGYPGGIRELQRNDETYAQNETWIDALMAS